MKTKYYELINEEGKLEGYVEATLKNPEAIKKINEGSFLIELKSEGKFIEKKLELLARENKLPEEFLEE